ncbi:hypothetical protein FA95DRAFT_770444 [Auriscalpium vulgare]|uniref:Uncharacterized protein n=1 Tax=Auriscalpium vulgare TaxID=40419 RepID=A0ACB8RBD5_9AGAM|nr:hypothetical protein FA95DRAFT_770444 [Auriscalpium vulgare]
MPRNCVTTPNASPKTFARSRWTRGRTAGGGGASLLLGCLAACHIAQRVQVSVVFGLPVFSTCTNADMCSTSFGFPPWHRGSKGRCTCLLSRPLAGSCVL